MVRRVWRIEVWICLKIFPAGPLFIPRFPPRPFTPAGVKGSLNSPFLFFGLLETLVRALAIRICVLRWVGAAVVVNGLGLGYFLLAKQKKVARPTGQNQYSKTLNKN
jgi:hypothetical protein